MRARERDIRASGANIVAIGLGDRHYARMFREDVGISFPLLIDEDRKAYAAAELKSASVWGLFRRETAAHRRRARAGGYRQGKLGKNPFQLGGTFVFGPGNVDRYAHVSQSTGDNAPIDELLRALQAALPTVDR